MRRWTQIELAEVKRRAEAGETDAQIARAMGATATSIKYVRTKRCGITRTPKQRMAIDDALRDIWATGARPSDTDLARRLGASKATIKKHRRQLGLRSNRSWTTHEISMLKHMWEAGQPDHEYISAYAERWPDRVPPTISQVRERRYLLGLSRSVLRKVSDQALMAELARRGEQSANGLRPAYSVALDSWASMEASLLSKLLADAGSVRRLCKIIDVPRSTLDAWVRRHKARGMWPQD